MDIGATDIVFGAVGVQRDRRSVEDQEQLGFSFVQPGEQAIEGGIAGLAFEDAVEAGLDLGSGSWELGSGSWAARFRQGWSL